LKNQFQLKKLSLNRPALIHVTTVQADVTVVQLPDFNNIDSSKLLKRQYQNRTGIACNLGLEKKHLHVPKK
jgi:hypothetical protein